MKRKSAEIHPMENGYVSGSALSLEIKQTEELLQTSCYWAINLAEGIEGFEDSFLSAVRYLDDLQEMPLKTKFDNRFVPKIRSTLRKIRSYCSRMAAEDKPLSVMGIVEDLQELELYSNKLRKLLELQKTLKNKS
jgi:hypothetical protein